MSNRIPHAFLALCLALALTAVTAIRVTTEVPVRARVATPPRVKKVSASGSAVGSLVTTPAAGPIQGVEGSLGFSYKGIPFGVAPVGPLRWAPPKPTPAFTTPFNATAYGNGCPQKCELPPGTCPTAYSEDCLNLNVFVPNNTTSTDNLPVLFFIPGGRFEQGAAGTGLYDGSVFASKNRVIVVTTNYRLGALGFMVTKGVPGNYGIMDQRLSLKWVGNNIAAFGGNPNAITVMGQSAGATSIAVHLASPTSKGLFHQAVLLSNPWSLAMKDTDTATKMGDKMTKELGCDEGDLVCLRNVTSDAVITAQYDVQNKFYLSDPLLLFYPWTPTVDGDQLSLQPIQAFQQGTWNKMPIIAGSVLNEAKLFIWQASSKRLSYAKYVAALTIIFKTHVRKVMKEYPVSPAIPGGNDTRPALSQLGTDYIFTCPTDNVTISAGNELNNNVWRYEFNHISNYDAWGPMYSECTTAVCHGADLPYVFQPSTGFQFQPDELTLSNEMIAYYGNFVNTGNPNQGPASISVQWPAFSSAIESNIVFATGGLNVTAPIRQAQCNFWDENIGYVMYDG